ncbi:unnamed protein product [Onchocerca flexuosa]|uniref:ABC transporter domain-containing protein n=1 Tax=Onchocerca flexuosa TaxID=387005 RepID=A0A183HM22_9BILA|nr:unnamed protein product [Onchocerca flexuosa]
MSAKFGQKIALVGSSGCGKSTIIKLLERFYDVPRGVLFIDDRDIKSYNIRYLRSHIALVDQEPTLFNLSIRDNIAYGLDNMSQDQIEAAAKLANIHNFIISLPQVCFRCKKSNIKINSFNNQMIYTCLLESRAKELIEAPFKVSI